MKKSKHFRKDVIMARVIAGVILLVLIVLLVFGISLLTKTSDEDKNSQNSQNTENTQEQEIILCPFRRSPKETLCTTGE